MTLRDLWELNITGELVDAFLLPAEQIPENAADREEQWATLRRRLQVVLCFPLLDDKHRALIEAAVWTRAVMLARIQTDRSGMTPGQESEHERETRLVEQAFTGATVAVRWLIESGRISAAQVELLEAEVLSVPFDE